MANRPEDRQQEARRLKELIIEEASNGRLDHSPLLTTPHPVTCPRCKHTFNIRFLDYLKKGLFRIGRPQAIEAESLLGAFMAIEEENVTTIILELDCEHCGDSVEIRPFTVEYLRVIANRSSPSRTMYA